MSSSNSPCAACKFLRRKCTLECVFAPYFPSDDPKKFVSVHKVFGASNVSKLLNEINVAQRKDAVESLAYEADLRLRDPVYGCVGLISVLQHKLRQVESDLFNAKKELAKYIGPQAMLPMIQTTHAFMPQQHLGNPSSSNNLMSGMNVPMMGIPTVQTHGAPLVIREPQHLQQQQHHQHPLTQQQQQMYEAQQLAAVVAAREQEMLKVYEAQQQQQQQQRHQHHQQPHQDFNGFNHGGLEGAGGSVTATGFHQVNAATISPSMTLGTFDNQYQIQPQQQEHKHHPLQEQILFQTQQPTQTQHPSPQTVQPPQQQTSGNDEGRSGGLS